MRLDTPLGPSHRPLSTRPAVLYAIIGSVSMSSGCTGERPHFPAMTTDAGDVPGTGADSGTGTGTGTSSATYTGSETETETETETGSATHDTGSASTSGTADASPGASDALPDGAPSGGVNCSVDDQCDGGWCVDGVCCDTTCDETCARCDAPGSIGTCIEVFHDPACGELACPANTECRTYESVDLENNCASIDTCVLAPTCTAVDLTEGTACQNEAGACNGKGECVVPDKKLLGEECVSGDECGSSHCATNEDSGTDVCCDTACDGLCASCTADGHCTATALDDMRCPTVTCADDTACMDYAEPLTSNRCVAQGQCVQQETYCTPDYSEEATACGNDRQCDDSGTCACANAGHELCEDTCVDTAHAADNCGTCGNVCPDDSQCVQGDCKSWGIPVKVADGTALAAAMDDQGNVFVVYMGGTDSASVYVRRKPSGGTWSSPHLLDDASTRGDFYTRPSLGVDNVGNALITWGSQDGYGYSRYRTNNNSWMAPAYVPTPAGMDAPIVAVASAGDAFAAWDNQVASAGTEVWLRGWGGASEAWYGAQSVSETTSSCLGSVGAGPDGTALIVYSEDAEVYARWWSPVTRDWLAAPTLLNEGYCFVSIAFDGDGTTVVASAGSENIYGSIATAQSGWTTEALAPPGEFSSYRNHVSAFAGRGGDAIIAIEQVGDYASVVAITWSTAAASWQGVTPLLPGSSTAEFREVSMALDATGSGFVVSSNQATGAVVGRRRNGATGDWEDVETLGPLQSGAGKKSNSPVVKVSDTGSAVLVWGESNGGAEPTIWSRHYE